MSQKIELPEAYCESMERLLQEEYQEYLDSMEQPSHRAIRINTAKVSVEEWKKICPFTIEQIPWTEKGFLLLNEEENPAKHPYYYAGLYYIQEPSAMIPASILPVQKGDRVLDLCAAPGGKATEIAAKLEGTGLLVANDISVSRTMALAKNLQIAGADNAVVTAEEPKKLAGNLPEYFDAILVDAPCSGEGMFRRDARMVKDWKKRGPQYYASIQRDILQEVYKMLKPGGHMVYSTCTFAPMEDEQMMQWFVEQYPDMSICEVQEQPGYCHGNPKWADCEDEEMAKQLSYCIRIFPHKAKGEGHFATLLYKAEKEPQTDLSDEKENWTQNDFGWQDRQEKHLPKGKKVEKYLPKGKKVAAGKGKSGKSAKNGAPDIEQMRQEAEKWLAMAKIQGGQLEQKKESFLYQKDGQASLKGCRCMQSGLIVGSMPHKWEPSAQLALAVKDIEAFPCVMLTADDEQVYRYLKGETLQNVSVTREERLSDTKDYVLVCVEGYPLGWGKCTQNGTIKNKYHAGWRMK